MNLKNSFARIALALACAGFLSACTTEPESGEFKNEIRIDLFSHFWESNKHYGVVVSPTKIIILRDSVDDENFIVDTLKLLNASRDKSASLPAHTVGHMFFGSDSTRPRLFYTTTSTPSQFACYYRNNGKSVKTSENAASAFLKIDNFIFSAGVPESTTGYVRLENASSVLIRAFECGYVEGKGFYLGSSSNDWYGMDPYNTGEFIIRY